jgi:L-malate glycosyltransferase
MRLGVITTMADNAWGGSEELWVSLANQALLSKHKVFASVYNWGELPDKIKEVESNGVKVYKRARISYSQLSGKIKGKIVQKTVAKNQLHSFVKKTTPNFLLISMGAFCDIEVNPFREFLKEVSVPYALIVHVNTEAYTINPAKIHDFRLVVKNAKCIYFVSKRLREQAERQLAYGFENSKIVVNPINMESTDVVPYPPSTTVNFACVGRLKVDVKGQSLLLQVLSKRKWKDRDWILNIYGSGPDEALLEELIAFYDLKNRVFLKGFVGDIRKDIWGENHLLLMPSYFEGLPIALVEAMLSGRSAVATDVGGNSEILKGDELGVIAEGITPSSFDKAMEDSWAKKDEWEAMGIKAHKQACEYFGNDPVSRLLEDIVEMYKDNK